MLVLFGVALRAGFFGTAGLTGSKSSKHLTPNDHNTLSPCSMGTIRVLDETLRLNEAPSYFYCGHTVL
jgi:hypothetical protein